MSKIVANTKSQVIVAKKGISVLSYSFIAIISVLLVVAPFYRGMYFRENYLPMIAFIGAAFVLLLVKQIKEKSGLIESYIDIAFLGLTLAYLFSYFFGISKANSLDGFIKYIAAFMVYKLFYELAKDSKLGKYLTDIIVFSGFVMALFSLLGAGGIVEIKGVFGWGERLNGLYQYPNSTASVLGGIFLLNIFLIMNKGNKYIKIAYFASASIIMLAFLETRSRGAMLTVVAAWALAFLLSKTKDKLLLIVYSGISIAISFMFYSKIYESFIEQRSFGIYFLGFIAIVIASGFVLELLTKQIQSIEIKNVNRILIGLFAALGAAIIIAFSMTTALELNDKQPQRGYEIYQVKPSTSYKLEFKAGSINAGGENLNVAVNSVDRSKARTSLANSNFVINSASVNTLEFQTNESTFYITIDFANITPMVPLSVSECTIKDGQSGADVDKLKLNYRFIPNDIAKKIDEISLKTESSSERIVFIKDGLKMAGDYFLTGTGAKGWSQLYTKYQSYGYVSREAHNYYLQTVIESGVLGLISLAGLLVLLLIAVVKLYMREVGNQYMLIGVMAMLFELLAHAFLDFDFSLFAMFLTVVSCIGWISSIAAKNGILAIKVNKGGNWINYAAVAVSAAIVIVSITIYSGIVDGNKGAALISTNPAEAKKYYESAIGKDFNNTVALMDYSQLLTLEAQQSKDKAVIDKIYENYKKVETFDPYEARYYPTMINFYTMFGYFDDASSLADKMIEVQPLKPESYELKANLSYQVMLYLMNINDYKKALQYNDFVLETEEQHKEANIRTIAPFGLNENTIKIIEEAKSIRASIESKIK